MIEPFLRWCSYVEENKKEEKADGFYKKRGAQYLHRLIWDALQMYAINKRHQDAQHQAVDGWHAKFLYQKALLSLKYHTSNQKRLNNISSYIKLQSDMNLQRVYFDALKEQIIENMFSSASKQKADAFYFQNTTRKALIGFQVSAF